MAAAHSPQTKQVGFVDQSSTVEGRLILDRSAMWKQSILHYQKRGQARVHTEYEVE
jgi:hypothetical protein